MSLPISSMAAPRQPLACHDLPGMRVTLRRLDNRDAEALFALYSDADVMRYWNHAPWTSVSEARLAIAEACADYVTGASLHCAIEHKATGQLVGSCALYARARQNRCASIGYMLSKDHQGHGYLGEAMQLLLAHAFFAWNLNRLEAEVNRYNAGSCRALERMGFHREGIMRERWIVAGKKHDTIAYALLRDDWCAALREGRGA